MPSTATQRFHNLPAAKRERVLTAATAEFAARGFEHANTNAIAQAADVSVGSLFQYFGTKEGLFLHVVHVGAEAIRARVRTIVDAPGTPLDKIEAILRLIVETSRTQRRMVELYHELTATGNREVTRQVALELESYTAGAYTALFAEAQRRGQVRDDIPASMLAFLVDNVFVSLQYACATDYFIDRFHIYLGPEGSVPDDDLVGWTLAFLTSSLRPEPSLHHDKPPSSSEEQP